MTATTTIDRARRLALAAQGLHRPRPDRVDVRHLRRTLAHNMVVQLDSVSVAARAHELPFWSRLGDHDRRRRDDWLWRSGENVELVAHEQSVVPVEVWPLLAENRVDGHRWQAVERLREQRPGYFEAVYDQVAERGPLTAAELDDGGGEKGAGMWGWSPGRVALAWLAARGRLTIAERDHRFQLRFDLTERVLPAAILAAPEPPVEEARRQLLLLAARAHGLGTAGDLADHWRLPIRDVRPLLEQLADAGALVRTRVEGWDELAYRHPEVPMPREVVGATLLSPFDPLVWCRPRLDRLWHFDYRIEIYVPKSKRRWGYYVLPLLLDGELVARVDLRADRDAAVLDVRAAWLEAGHDGVRVARALAAELHAHARWLGLDAVRVDTVGDLAVQLGASV